jgi:hypothetical protein
MNQQNSGYPLSLSMGINALDRSSSMYALPPNFSAPAPSSNMLVAGPGESGIGVISSSGVEVIKPKRKNVPKRTSSVSSDNQTAGSNDVTNNGLLSASSHTDRNLEGQTTYEETGDNASRNDTEGLDLIKKVKISKNGDKVKSLNKIPKAPKTGPADSASPATGTNRKTEKKTKLTVEQGTEDTEKVTINPQPVPVSESPPKPMVIDLPWLLSDPVPAPLLPPHKQNLWGFLLSEVAWMAVDFRQELRMKYSLTRAIATACAEKVAFNNAKSTRENPQNQAEEYTNMRKEAAKALSTRIVDFWKPILEAKKFYSNFTLTLPIKSYKKFYQNKQYNLNLGLNHSPSSSSSDETSSFSDHLNYLLRSKRSAILVNSRNYESTKTLGNFINVNWYSELNQPILILCSIRNIYQWTDIFDNLNITYEVLVTANSVNWKKNPKAVWFMLIEEISLTLKILTELIVAESITSCSSNDSVHTNVMNNELSTLNENGELIPVTMQAVKKDFQVGSIILDVRSLQLSSSISTMASLLTTFKESFVVSIQRICVIEPDDINKIDNQLKTDLLNWLQCKTKEETKMPYFTCDTAGMFTEALCYSSPMTRIHEFTPQNHTIHFVPISSRVNMKYSELCSYLIPYNKDVNPDNVKIASTIRVLLRRIMIYDDSVQIQVKHLTNGSQSNTNALSSALSENGIAESKELEPMVSLPLSSSLHQSKQHESLSSLHIFLSNNIPYLQPIVTSSSIKNVTTADKDSRLLLNSLLQIVKEKSNYRVLVIVETLFELMICYGYFKSHDLNVISPAKFIQIEDDDILHYLYGQHALRTFNTTTGNALLLIQRMYLIDPSSMPINQVDYVVTLYNQVTSETISILSNKNLIKSESKFVTIKPEFSSEGDQLEFDEFCVPLYQSQDLIENVLQADLKLLASTEPVIIQPYRNIPQNNKDNKSIGIAEDSTISNNNSDRNINYSNLVSTENKLPISDSTSNLASEMMSQVFGGLLSSELQALGEAVMSSSSDLKNIEIHSPVKNGVISSENNTELMVVEATSGSKDSHIEEPTISDIMKNSENSETIDSNIVNNYNLKSISLVMGLIIAREYDVKNHRCSPYNLYLQHFRMLHNSFYQTVDLTRSGIISQLSHNIFSRYGYGKNDSEELILTLEPQPKLNGGNDEHWAWLCSWSFYNANAECSTKGIPYDPYLYTHPLYAVAQGELTPKIPSWQHTIHSNSSLALHYGVQIEGEMRQKKPRPTDGPKKKLNDSGTTFIVKRSKLQSSSRRLSGLGIGSVDPNTYPFSLAGPITKHSSRNPKG